MQRRIWTATVIVLTLAVAGCSSDDPVAESAADLCASLESLDSTLQQIAGADASGDSTTVDDVQNAASDLESGVEDVESAESDLDDSLKTQLEDDLSQLQSSIEGISGDSTLAEAGQDIVSALSAFRQSWDQTLSGLNCSTES